MEAKFYENVDEFYNLINVNLKSQAIASQRIIDETVDNLKETISNLKIANINRKSVRRILHITNGNSKKIPGLPLELPN